MNQQTETQSWEVRAVHLSGLFQVGNDLGGGGAFFNMQVPCPWGQVQSPAELSSVASEEATGGVAIEPREALAH